MLSSVGFIGGLGQVRLTLELTPQPNPTGGDILAVAILTTERNPMPLEGQTVAFYLGPNEVSAQASGADGRTAYTFTGLGFGTHAISVQIAGVHVTQRHTLAKPAEKVKPPAKLSVSVTGPRGRQRLLIGVTAGDESFIPGFVGMIQDGDRFKTFTTRPNGMATYPTRFREASRRFEVRVGNEPNLIWRARLLGPKPSNP